MLAGQVRILLHHLRITGGDAAAINLAASAGGNAAGNNFLGHIAQSKLDSLRAKAANGGLTQDEQAQLVALEQANQLSDGLLNKYRNGATLSQNDKYNLGVYLGLYQQQDGAPATADLIKNGSNPTYGWPYAGSTADQTAYMNQLRADNGGGLLSYLTTSRDPSANESLFNTAKRDSGMGGSFVNGIIPNEAYLPLAMLNDYATLDGLRNNPVLTSM